MDQSQFRVTDEKGRVIQRGDDVQDFRGDWATFDRVTRGTEYNGTAKVTVTKDGRIQENYERVWGLTVERVS